MVKDFVLRRYVTEKDALNVYKVYSDYKEQFNLFSVMNMNSFENFPKWIQKRLDFFYNDFLIIEKKDGDFIGFFIAYDLSENDGTIKLLQYVRPEHRMTGLPAFAGIEFLDTMFRYHNVRKMYSEVYSFNNISLTYQKSFGFTEETRFKEYHYYNGKYWDSIFLSITREEFYNRYGKIIEQFQ